MDTPVFKIGIDGGGTKTEFILTDATGAITARRLAPGCNPSLIAHETVHTLIVENLRALTAAAQQHHPNARIAHTLFCMAGSPAFWREFGAQLTFCGQVQTCGDSIPVLELATGGAPGLVLHSGTGSFVAARAPDDSIHYAGGLGWRFGDPGSAHDLGRRAVARTQLELQGWADRSALSRAVCTATGCNDAPALSRHFYTPATSHVAVAGLAPHVTAAAAAGDPAAVAIFEESLGGLAALATMVVNRLFTPSLQGKIPCGLSGAILQTSLALALLEKSPGSRVAFRLITDPPIEGVRRMLARL